MRPKLLILLALGLVVLTIGIWSLLKLRNVFAPTTSLYGIKTVPKVVDFTKIPWRYGGPGNVFEVPKIDVKEMAEILKKEGFKEEEVFHAYSSTPEGPKVYVDSHEFTRTTKAGTTENLSIMKCDGVSALMHWETTDIEPQ